MASRLNDNGSIGAQKERDMRAFAVGGGAWRLTDRRRFAEAFN
jgi:hypothetical protein